VRRLAIIVFAALAAARTLQVAQLAVCIPIADQVIG
jgi:hypothetical protein